VNTHHWNPNILDLSPIFEPFNSLRKLIKTFPTWPSIEDFELLKQTAGRPIMTRSGKPICFVPQAASAYEFSQQYEPRIFLHGEVQTRNNNWHDFFNALVWMIFPQTKAVLNQIHFNELQHALQNNQKQRGLLRDAATLFDESGVIVVCSQKDLIALLKKHEWKQLFWEQRKAVLSSMRFFVFGHGLYEKALNPYIGMTGKGVIFHVEKAYFNQSLSEQIIVVDKMLETMLLQEKFSSADLTPMPLLGYPAWSNDNCNSVFYDNKQYFRPHPSQR
jgi:DUF3025 family protein